MNYKGKKILFAVLNWGLGHATRSAELIRQLEQNNTITIASDGAALEFLQQKFPNLKHLRIPGYDIRYSKTANPLNLFLNALKTQKAVKKEQQWLKPYLTQNATDLIISDNRYGIFSKAIESVMITHQLNIQVPFLSGLVNRQNHTWLNRFNEIWVPDEQHALSGALSCPIPPILKNKVKEIGWLSRFSNFTAPSFTGEHILAIISGPEPQKTILFDLLVKKLKNLNESAVIYTGNINTESPQKTGNLTIKNHTNDQALFEDICKAKLIISRPGYSSLMDYKKLDKPLLLIPTPGQTEQEYLGTFLNKAPNITTIQQKKLAYFNMYSLL